ncbi:MAG: choice-of-anchor D domain-containing protein [Spirochaetales bacterium]|nr:choice-of-anchor D domain-containing protein [Spirochaetales bacterium]
MELIQSSITKNVKRINFFVIICLSFSAIFLGCSAGGGGGTGGGGEAPEMDVTWDGTDVDDGAVNFDLGTIQIDQTLEYTFTITNSGNLDLNLTGNPDKIVLAGAGFSKDESATAAVLAQSASTTFEVELDATGSVVDDVYTADISIDNDDGDENPYDFSVQVTVVAQAPEINVKQDGDDIISGSAFDFEDVQIGASPAVTFTIENLGMVDLNLDGVPDLVSFVGDAQFTVTADPLTPVVSGGSTTFEITYTPTAEEINTATISIANDDSDEDPYTITLAGTGVVAEPEINIQEGGADIPNGTVNYDLGNTFVGTPLDVTFTIENEGYADLNLSGAPIVVISDDADGVFSLDTDAATPVAGPGSTTFIITYDPAAEVTSTATITVESDDTDEATYSFSIQAAGVIPLPEINVQEGGVDVPDGTVDYDVGETRNDTPMNITFTIQNTGDDVLNLTAGPPRVTVSGDAEFALDTDAAASVAAHGSTTFIIAFDPAGVDGTYNASISIDHDDTTDDENPYNFSIAATAATPGIYVEENSVEVTQASTVDYGTTTPGTPVVKTYTVTNDGNNDLTITSIVLTGTGSAEYTLDTTGVVSPIAPTASGTFTLTFDANSGGTYAGIITITNDDPVDASYVFNTTAACTGPEIQLVRTTGTGSPKIEVIAAQDNWNNQVSTITFQIDNLGNTDLNVSNITITNDGDGAFALEVLVYPIVISASGSTTFDIEFTPGDTDFHNCTLTVYSDDYDEATFTVPLRARIQ